VTLLSSKEPYRQTDRQTHRHTEPINGSKFHHSTERLMLETITIISSEEKVCMVLVPGGEE